MLRRLLPLLAALALLASATGVALRFRTTPSTMAGDLMPLWLGAKAWASGRDPTDPAVLEAIFRAEDLKLRVGGFWSYYPPTAALFGLPLAGMPFKAAVGVWRHLALALLAVGIWAASGRRFVGGLLAAALLQTRIAWVVVSTGQPSPLVLCFTGLALLAGSRPPPGRGRSGPGLDPGVVAGAQAASVALPLALGIAAKLVPVVMLPALVVERRWRALGLSLGFLAAFFTLALLGAPWSPRAWFSGLAAFLDPQPYGPWLHNEPAWVLQLWRLRGLGVLGWLLALGFAAWRRPGFGPVAALGVATVGLQMAGSHHYHEAIVLFPALAWLAGRSLLHLGATVALLGLAGAWDRGLPPNSLHWLPVAWATWAAVLGQLLWTRPAAREAAAPGA